MTEKERADMLRDYVDTLFQQQRIHVDVMFQQQREAVQLARSEMNRRLESLNELRREVTDDRNRFVTRDSFDIQMSVLNEFRNRALGVAIVLSLFSGAVGAWVSKLF